MVKNKVCQVFRRLTAHRGREWALCVCPRNQQQHPHQCLFWQKLLTLRSITLFWEILPTLRVILFSQTKPPTLRVIKSRCSLSLERTITLVLLFLGKTSYTKSFFSLGRQRPVNCQPSFWRRTLGADDYKHMYFSE